MRGLCAETQNPVHEEMAAQGDKGEYMHIKVCKSHRHHDEIGGVSIHVPLFALSLLQIAPVLLLVFR
jgi:hypothetical protein